MKNKKYINAIMDEKGFLKEDLQLSYVPKTKLDKNPLERIEKKIEKIFWLFPTPKKEATREIMLSIQQIIKGIPSEKKHYSKMSSEPDNYTSGFNAAMDLVEKYKAKIIGGKNEITGD